MKNKSIIIAVVLLIIVGAAAFFGGMQYQKTQVSGLKNVQIGGPNGQAPEGFKRRMGNGQAVAPVSGEIISQDDNSVTVKLQDGSSKIVILSDDTSINKSLEGSKSDLKTGERITAFGTTNSDGSITAQNVAIGGNMMFRGDPPGNAQPTQGN